MLAQTSGAVTDTPHVTVPAIYSLIHIWIVCATCLVAKMLNLVESWNCQKCNIAQSKAASPTAVFENQMTERTQRLTSDRGLS